MRTYFLAAMLSGTALQFFSLLLPKELRIPLQCAGVIISFVSGALLIAAAAQEL